MIHGGSGGVGHFAIQFATTMGAQCVTRDVDVHVLQMMLARTAPP